MKTRTIMLFLLPLLALSAPGRAQVQSLPGPDLNAAAWGWPNLGLQITALQDSVLQRFVFNNQGRADVLTLLDADGAVVGDYGYQGGEGACRVEAGWPLREGQTYFLVSQDMNNGTWASFSDYPVANDHIRVDGAVGNGVFYTFIWFNFNALETTGAAGAAALPVAVDVRPGSTTNPLNLRSRGKFPVAILSDELFDARTLVVESMQLAGAGVAVPGNGRPLAKPADVNGDGRPDLLALFSTAEIDPGLIVDGWVTLTAVTSDGTSVEGGDNVRIVPRPAHRGPRAGR